MREFQWTWWQGMAASLILALLMVPMCFGVSSAAQRLPVVVWSYYVFPPFVVEGNQGLAHDFIELMNAEARGEFVFHLDVMPRKRIDLHLDMGDSGIVLFVNPAWIHARDKDKASWTPPIFQDRNGIISNVSRKLDYVGPGSVAGMKMGGVLGRKYQELDQAVASGLITRHDAQSEEINVLKLAERRIDFMTAPESVLRYLVGRLGLEDRIYFSLTPLFEYTRHILMSNVSDELRTFLMQFVENLPNNPEWLAIKERYKLH